jgi:hypothetical protein
LKVIELQKAIQCYLETTQLPLECRMRGLQRYQNVGDFQQVSETTPGNSKGAKLEKEKAA